MMMKKFVTLSLLALTIGLTSCNKDEEEDDQSQAGSMEATIDGNSYSFNLGQGSYSSGSQRLILPASCGDCPYSLELVVLDGLEPRTVTSAGSSDDASYGRIEVTFHDMEGEPSVQADTATITIDSHNESAQTISGSFSFSKYSNSQNKNYVGSGTFQNAYYD